MKCRVDSKIQTWELLSSCRFKCYVFRPWEVIRILFGSKLMTKQEKNNDVWMMFLSAKVVSFNAAISACEKGGIRRSWRWILTMLICKKGWLVKTCKSKTRYRQFGVPMFFKMVGFLAGGFWSMVDMATCRSLQPEQWYCHVCCWGIIFVASSVVIGPYPYPFEPFES